ncbi:MAG: exosortase Q [Sulfurifustis sp.]
MNSIKLGWVDRLPAWLWIALPAVALLPVWRWCAARLLDRSDDPLGIVALAALAILVVAERERFGSRPRGSWLVVATLLTAVAVLGGGVIPALARGVVAVFAVCAALIAVRAAGQPMLALTGLALLALPLLASLQFFIGYPLRVVTAEASRWLLGAFGVAAARDGTALTVAGRLIMVDAPCSGIHMGWIAYFTACVAAAWWRIPDGRFLRRLPLVGVAVLGGNIVRNALLVAQEAKIAPWPDCAHEAVGVAIFLLVCLAVVWHVATAARAPGTVWEVRTRADAVAGMTDGRAARVFALTVLAVLMLWPWVRPEPALARAAPAAIEWPREIEGRPLRPLALSAVEQQFAEQFPGAIARFTDGERVVVLRQVTSPTRRLHPATDCYRGLGYRVRWVGLEREDSGYRAVPAIWRCFIAEKDGRRVRVCENIVDADGQMYTDTSAWYWAALTGRSHGPWRAVTRATLL